MGVVVKENVGVAGKKSLQEGGGHVLEVDVGANASHGKLIIDVKSLTISPFVDTVNTRVETLHCHHFVAPPPFPIEHQHHSCFGLRLLLDLAALQLEIETSSSACSW